MYRMTQDGFTVLAMGYTGKKAMEFKEAYIAAFNRMQEALALNIGIHAANLQRKKGIVLVFSLEMSKVQLGYRALAADGRIDLSRLRTGDLDVDGWDRLAASTDKLSQLPVVIDDTSGLSIGALISTCKYFHRTEPDGIAMVIVDYLQLMTAGKKPNREQEIAEISRGLKGVAKELMLPVIALSQLNRGLESRTNKRPQLADLRESGAIEQDADIILFIYRDEVYHEDSPEKGIAEIQIAKHRNGPTGTVRLSYSGQYTKFDNLATNATSPERWQNWGNQVHA